MIRLFMLDTDTAKYTIRGTVRTLDAHLKRRDVRQVCISAVTRAELRFGVRRLRNAGRLEAQIEQFLGGVQTLAWDETAADRFAGVRAALERGGTPIGSMDIMIAAYALAVDATLVTNNVKHFRPVKGLSLENWIG